MPADQPGHQPMHLPGRLAGKPGSSSGSGVRVLGVPVAPAGIGLILGPLVEVHFRRALSISQSDWTVLFTDRSRLPC